MQVCPGCKNGLFGQPEGCSVCGGDLRGLPGRDGASLGGMRVGEKYVLAELLGEGAMGWVYRAQHRELGRTVVIKLLKAHATEVDEVTRFEREARAVSRLTHPHIVSVIDSGITPGGILYIVMEHVPGPTLFDVLLEEPLLPLSRAFGLFQQVCAAVEEAHGMRVIHRDLKPENIIVTSLRSGDDFAKVLDFGVASLGDDKGERVTADGSFIGTPGYIAPENIAGEPPTERTDVYSLGVILYQLLAGREPFDETSVPKLLSLHLAQKPPTLAEAAPDRPLNDALEQVVQRALAKEPADRFPSVADLRDAAFAALGQLREIHVECDRCRRPIDPLTGQC
ncbi:MAG: serine/threonine protein kinase, partial [Deltaproteobacteria bacterium]|nr:serine/threonine protein kinase [Deltaproteobacteria bacterium]MBW2536080.1 serine/threonine protein kinase [Deltaproteobacteria bacterium]